MTNKIKIVLLSLVALLVMASCDSDSYQTGTSLMDSSDSVLVFVDTVQLSSSLLGCTPIISNPDSFLLGEMETGYGTTRAEILTQLSCPVGYRYPEGAELDSVCLYLYYKSFYGDGLAPLQINVQELDRNTLVYSKSYRSDIDIEEYCSREDSTNVLARRHIIIPARAKDSVVSNSEYYGRIRMRMSDRWAEHFFRDVRAFSSQNEFNELMKGFYITTDFGGTAIVNVNTLALSVYYHFTYDKAGRDTTVTDMKSFYANSEVRQVNRIRYLDNDLGGTVEDLTGMLNNPDSNFIIAPAGVYTSVSIPMRAMIRHIYGDLTTRDGKGNTYTKRPYVNKAEMLVRVRNVYTGSEYERTRDNWAQPAASILLLRDYAVETFFVEKMLPSDTLAVLGTLSADTDDDGNTYYCYSYDISPLLTLQLRDSAYADDTLRMVMVPVSVESTTTSSSTSVTAVKQSQSLSTTIINSATRSDINTEPLALEVVYSGF